MIILMLAFVCGFGPLFVARALAHDRRLEPAEVVDWDAAEEEAQTRYEDDADSYRKGER